MFQWAWRGECGVLEGFKEEGVLVVMMMGREWKVWRVRREWAEEVQGSSVVV